MKQVDLWPPLSQIQREIQCEATPPDLSAGSDFLSPGKGADALPVAVDTVSLLLPLTEWSRRREAAWHAAFPLTWGPGRLVGVAHGGMIFGVLLDRHLKNNRWQAWMTAPECDWAGPYDVLIEPQDEPFDPICGVIQTWNALTLQFVATDRIRTLGMLSSARLEAVRAVHQEFLVQRQIPVLPEPGRVALRAVGPAHSVLTGTPLLDDDPRLAYQALYRKVGLALH